VRSSTGTFARRHAAIWQSANKGWTCSRAAHARRYARTMKYDKHAHTSPQPRLRPLASTELHHVQGGVSDETTELDADGRLRKRRYEESNEQA
jgi:hypothetical protein